MQNFKFGLLIIFIFPLYVFSQLPYPTKYPTAIIPQDGHGNILFFLYNPMQYIDGGQDTFKLYYLKS